MGRMGERVFESCAAFCTRHPWQVIAMTVVLTVLSAWYSTFLTINTSTDDILDKALPFKQIEAQYRTAFPKQEWALVIVDGATPADADSAADNLAVRLRGRPDLFTDVEVPGTAEFFTDNGILFLGIDKLREFLSQLESARTWLTQLGRDPSVRGIATLVSSTEGAPDQPGEAERARLLDQLGETASAKAEGDDVTADWLNILGITRPEGQPGTRRFVLSKPVLDNSSINRAGPALDALNEEIKGVEGEEAEGLKMQVTGDPSLRQQELDDAFSGAIAASGLSFILVALSLVLGIRSGRLILVLLITLVVGGLWTTGLATLFVGRLNLISVAFMVLFVGLGVDFGTHLGLRFLEELKKGGTFQEAMTDAMLGEAPSIGLSTLCAIVAFLSFVPTAYTGLAEFGIISALGMVVAFVVTFTVQPALMALMPPKVPSWGNYELGVGNFIKRYHRPILVVSGIITIGALFAATNARIDVNPLNLQDPKAAPVIAYRDLANDPATSPYSLNVVAANLEDARTRAGKLAAIPGVARVATAEQFLPNDQPEKLAAIAATRDRLGPEFFDENGSQTPPNDAELSRAFATLRTSSADIAAKASEGSELKAAAAKLSDGLAAFAEKRGTNPPELRELETALIGSLPEIVDAFRERLTSAHEVGIPDLPPEVARDWVAPDGRLRLQIQPAENIGTPEGLETFAQKIQAVEPEASGVPVSVSEAGTAILYSFAEAVLWTTIAIALIVIFLRRRVSDVILILAPLAVAAIWTVACSALLNLPFNFANVIVIPLLIGLGVAGSVHIVVRSRELAHEHGDSPEHETDVLDTSTSLAVLVAQLNTVAAFATLAISHHRGLYSMGLLLGLAILLVVIVCLVVLPAAMIALHRRRKPKPVPESVQP